MGGFSTICRSFGVAVVLTGCQSVQAEEISGVQIGSWDKVLYSQEPNDCDRMASYSADHQTVAPPVAHAQIDVPAAIAACRAAIEAEPGNPRMHYELARLLGYAGDEDGAHHERLTAAAAGYPSAIYIVGHLMATDKNNPNPCGGAQLVRRSAEAGSFAGQVGLASFQLDGTFAGCPAEADKPTLLALLAQAKGDAKNYFETLLTRSLIREVEAQP